MRKEWKHYTPEEKVSILRRHLLDKVPVSMLCEELQLQPTVFYHWLKQFFENGAVAFQRPRDSSHKRERSGSPPLEKKLRTKAEVLAELMEEHVALKKSWGDLRGQWVPHDTRDQVIDFVRRWNERTAIATQKFVGWLGVAPSKFYNWRARYGRVNEHNGWGSRDFWLEA